METSKEINSKLITIFPELIEIRREIHKYPEIAFNEKKTSSLIFDYLRKLGINVSARIAETGVTGLINGNFNGRTVALRADMDALPITEENNYGYKSCVPGMMHACGHDVHIACLLGAANILNGMKDRLSGNVKLIFQPAEEGVGGAMPMIREGVLKNPNIDACAALHVWPDIPVGKICINYGTVYASGDRLEITIKGKGGHGAVPQYTIDPIITAAEIVNALQTLISRRTDALSPVVLSICSFHAGTAYSIIPDTAIMKGTVRTVEKETRIKIPGIIENIIAGIAASSGAEYEFKCIEGYPSTVNDEAVTKIMEKSAAKIIGEANVLKSNRPSMVSEDFSYFAETVPCTCFRLGCGNREEGITYPLHNSKFAVDEECIKAGAGIMAQFAINYLDSHK